ncbi:AAA family ATPase [Seiridium cupressi]
MLKQSICVSHPQDVPRRAAYCRYSSMNETTKNPIIAVSSLLDGLHTDNLEEATALWDSKFLVDPFKVSDLAKGNVVSIEPHNIRVRLDESTIHEEITISRDQTRTSNYSQDQLIAATNEDQENKDWQNWGIWYEEGLGVSKSARKLRLKTWDNCRVLNLLDFSKNLAIQWHTILKQSEQQIDLKTLPQKIGSLEPELDSDDDTVIEEDSRETSSPESQSLVHVDSSNPIPLTNIKTTTTGPKVTESNMAAGKEDSSLDLTVVRSLLERIEKLEADNASLRDIVKQNGSEGSAGQLPNGLVKVHRVGDDMFLDEPSWLPQAGGQLDLKGHEPILDLDSYLKRHPEIAFLVFLNYDSSSTDDLGSESRTGHTSSRVRPVGETDSDSSYEVSAPYLFWYFARSERSSALSEMSDEHSELMILLGDFLEKSQELNYQQVSDGLEQGRISKNRLQYLFRPGTVMVSFADGLPQGYIVRDFAGVAVEGNEFIEVDESFIRKSGRRAVLRFPTHEQDKEVQVTSLTSYPIALAQDDLLSKLDRRATLFWGFRTHRLVQYIHEVYRSEPQRYIVDYKTYRRVHKISAGILRDTVDRNELLFDPNTGPTGNYRYLFPPETIAYNLERKSWEDIAIHFISEVQWDKKAFDNLVLSDNRTKELIHALITTKLAAEKGQGADLIKGKGYGLIMLLHGGPGTGKTITAEAVAEIAEKPLYRVTCGDIGTKPQEVERYLELVFYLGRTWDSVILLDEADVFLEQRGLSDLDRNALVSVFLRVLEYFEGILVLTSNRVGTFDEAFKSRIQLALHYPNLNVPQRRKIWRTFLNRLRSIAVGQIDYDDIFDNLDDLARRDINGRAIRNALTTARQLAQYRRQIMTFADLEYVINVASKFDDYIQSEIREGLSDDQFAREKGDR